MLSAGLLRGADRRHGLSATLRKFQRSRALLHLGGVEHVICSFRTPRGPPEPRPRSHTWTVGHGRCSEEALLCSSSESYLRRALQREIQVQVQIHKHTPTPTPSHTPTSTTTPTHTHIQTHIHTLSHSKIQHWTPNETETQTQNRTPIKTYRKTDAQNLSYKPTTTTHPPKLPPTNRPTNTHTHTHTHSVSRALALVAPLGSPPLKLQNYVLDTDDALWLC